MTREIQQNKLKLNITHNRSCTEQHEHWQYKRNRKTSLQLVMFGMDFSHFSIKYFRCTHYIISQIILQENTFNYVTGPFELFPTEIFILPEFTQLRERISKIFAQVPTEFTHPFSRDIHHEPDEGGRGTARGGGGHDNKGAHKHRSHICHGWAQILGLRWYLCWFARADVTCLRVRGGLVLSMMTTMTAWWLR